MLVDEKVGTSAETTAAVETGTPEKDETEDQGVRDAGDTGEKVPWNKDPRFQGFIRDRKLLEQYRTLGSPDQIAGRLTAIERMGDRLETMERDTKTAQAKTPDQVDLEAKLAAARKELRTIDPDLEKIHTLEEKIGRIESSFRQSADTLAVDETTRCMQETGLPVSEGSLRVVSTQLAALITGDPVLHAEYLRDTRRAVRSAFEQLAEFGKTIGTRTAKAKTERDKQTLQNLPKTHAAGGAAGGLKPETKIGGLKDAARISKERMRSQEV